MGWRLKRKSKNSTRWYLQQITDKGLDKITGKPRRKYKSISLSKDLRAHGFNPFWKYDEAKHHYDNKFKQKQKDKFDADYRQKVLERHKKAEIIKSIFLPEDLVNKFYEEFLMDRFCIASAKKELPKGYDGYWNSAMEVIADVQIEPHEYFMKPMKFYNYAIDRGLSPSWFRKITRFINLWGYFYCYETKQSYLPLPPPRKQYQQAMYDAFFEKRGGNLESDPITFEMLRKVKISDEHNKFGSKTEMQSNHWKFLWICTSFGLRPSECERILGDKTNKYHRAAKDKNGILCLHIYQPKLISLPQKKRWKIIPVLFSEQIEAIQYIKEQQFKKPLTKTIHRLISDNCNNYGCRKGFFDTMTDRGQKMENVSLWLGHTSLDRSLKSYRQRNVVHYDLPETGKALKSVG